MIRLQAGRQQHVHLATAQGPQSSTTRILSLTPLVNDLATLIGAALGGGSKVDMGDLGMSSSSGAGAYLYIGARGSAVALVAVPHESLHARQVWRYTGNFVDEGGAPMSAVEREVA
ncbi:MAG: hypothetical protein ACOYMY_06955, partial [Prochlorococcaceae cyanobacterium]